MNALLAQGDLFLIAAILAAGAIGEVVFTPLSDMERIYGIAAIGFRWSFAWAIPPHMHSRQLRRPVKTRRRPLVMLRVNQSRELPVLRNVLHATT